MCEGDPGVLVAESLISSSDCAFEHFAMHMWGDFSEQRSDCQICALFRSQSDDSLLPTGRLGQLMARHLQFPSVSITLSWSYLN